MVAVPPALAAESWVDNPNVDNLNPGTKSGQEIFEKKKVSRRRTTSQQQRRMPRPLVVYWKVKLCFKAKSLIQYQLNITRAEIRPNGETYFSNTALFR